MYFIRILAAAVMLTAVADYFFYGHEPGWTLGGFLAVAGICAWLCGERKPLSGPEKLLLVYIGLAAAVQIIDPDGMTFMLGLAGLAMFRMSRAYGWEARSCRWLMRWIVFILRGWLQPVLDLRKIDSGHCSGGVKNVIRLALHWLVPVLVTVFFAGLLVAANPLFQKWAGEIFPYLMKIELPSPVRGIFWIFCFVWLYGWLRMEIGQRFACCSEPDGEATVNRFDPAGRLRSEVVGRMMVRCLVLLNILFLIQNAVDIEYLWAGMRLPPGLTYADYAHHGAYPLIFTALLAGGMVTVSFAGNGTSPVWRRARLLVMIWLGQNVFLTASAMLRLEKYIEAYSLTLMRVAALVWMALVVAGLILIAVKIVAGKRNRWLVNANVLMVAVVLLINGFIDWRGRVATYNVRHCREMVSPAESNNRPQLDLRYLRYLGPAALPALRELEKNPRTAAMKFKKEEDPAAIAKELWLDNANTLVDWRAWSWRRSQLSKAD